MSKVLYRDIMPYVIFIACFIPTLFSYYFNIPIFSTMYSNLRDWSSLIGTTAMFLGLANITLYSYRNIRARKPFEWQLGIYTIFLMFAWIIVGLYYGGLASPAYWNMYIYVKAQCWAAQIGLLTFFFVSAAFRTFRAKNVQALVLLIFAFIPFIGVAAWGEVVWKGWPALSEWVLDNVAMAGSRAIIISASVGLVTMITRVVLRYEKGGLVRE